MIARLQDFRRLRSVPRPSSVTTLRPIPSRAERIASANARLAAIWSSPSSSSSLPSRGSMADFDDEITPQPIAVYPGMTAQEADLELCRHENERLRLQLATMRAAGEEKDDLIRRLKMELKRRVK